MPRYHQIAQALRDRIRSGDIAPGARLDNQRRLAEGFDVTLMTLRQALEVLEREGLIMRRHGLGTFVALPSVDYDILNFRAFAGDLSAVGEDVTTRFLRSHFSPSDRLAARELGLEPGARVFALERLRRARETVSAETLPARAARELGCAPGAPCFRSDRVSVDAEARPIVYDRVFIPGDRFRITRQLHYDRSVTA